MRFRTLRRRNRSIIQIHSDAWSLTSPVSMLRQWRTSMEVVRTWTLPREGMMALEGQGSVLFLWGESIRGGAELPDLFSPEMKGEGVTPCWAMLLIMSNGKTNRFNRLEYGWPYAVNVLRHRGWVDDQAIRPNRARLPEEDPRPTRSMRSLEA